MISSCAAVISGFPLSSFRSGENQRCGTPAPCRGVCQNASIRQIGNLDFSEYADASRAGRGLARQTWEQLHASRGIPAVVSR